MLNINNQIEIYKLGEEDASFEVRLENESIWLSQKQMAELFEKDTDTIGLHLKNIYKTEELLKKTTTEKFSVVQNEGDRSVN